ncbi:Sodium/hydrogen exchanger family-domain-containing protein [Lipomyces oligophaga]|uniref:Sodium/hydrogen exchanger family-domain-containing protein n=1 Tax=Lipomyces oligophaga TaxID=45792 RepID=UPI0034CD89F4
MATSSSVFSGRNPTEYDKSDPLVLFIIQLVIILVFCRLLHFPLMYLRQPRVIAEVIGGVLLGPSVMGRIPHFKNAIFPTDSIPMLTLVANLGLVFFLFLVGLELDLSLIVKNIRTACTVAALSIVIPFGLGVAVSVGLYNEFSHEVDQHISFGLFALFVGVAMAITAFPVLARILTELKLLQTYVGIVVLSSGVSNDIIGWILLALTIALTNATSGIIVLWIFLVTIGWAVFLFFAVRPLLEFIARKTGSLDEGEPSQTLMLSIFLVVVVSAFLTDVIGVHAIFGAFLAGMVVPKDKLLRENIADKMEVIITLLFLPLYFALSGLNTNLGLLDNGITWGYTILIIVVAMISKFSGATVGARMNGLQLRESCAVGALMSCKGLVELIVLNVGLQANIISQRVFTMFVVMALICTFVTTPLTMWIYPESYQEQAQLLHQRNEGEPEFSQSSGAEPSRPGSAHLRFSQPVENDFAADAEIELEPSLTHEKQNWYHPFQRIRQKFPRYL